MHLGFAIGTAVVGVVITGVVVATIVDVTGLVIYFAVAMAILGV